ncbi:uncharacterized protein LOC121054158 [Oryza brachyantha]|uniref:uncharacterized protein LOC121054158 n=1 Tax=Oryza brachyantha TaxID=4533 RepID=UPI001ADC8D28|nr:uncharacterized protein LOC121054158 [Oryza brachyantha]
MSDDQLEQLEEEDLAALINKLSRAMNNIRFKKRGGPIRCFACGGLDHIRSHCPKLGRAKKDDNGDKFKDDKPRSSFKGRRSKESLKKMLDQVCVAFEPLSDVDGDSEEDENKGRHISGVCLMSRDESDSEGEDNELKQHRDILDCSTCTSNKMKLKYALARVEYMEEIVKTNEVLSCPKCYNSKSVKGEF